MLQRNFLEKIKTHIFLSIIFFFESLAVYKVEKYCRAGQTTDDNMAHGNCTLDT